MYIYTLSLHNHLWPGECRAAVALISRSSQQQWSQTSVCSFCHNLRAWEFVFGQALPGKRHHTFPNRDPQNHRFNTEMLDDLGGPPILGNLPYCQFWTAHLWDFTDEGVSALIFFDRPDQFSHSVTSEDLRTPAARGWNFLAHTLFLSQLSQCGLQGTSKWNGTCCLRRSNAAARILQGDGELEWFWGVVLVVFVAEFVAILNFHSHFSFDYRQTERKSGLQEVSPVVKVSNLTIHSLPGVGSTDGFQRWTCRDVSWCVIVKCHEFGMANNLKAVVGSGNIWQVGTDVCVPWLGCRGQCLPDFAQLNLLVQGP